MFATLATAVAFAAAKAPPKAPTALRPVPEPESKPPNRVERICRRCSTTWRTDPVRPETCWMCGLPGAGREWPDPGFPQLVHGFTPLYPANETEL